MTTEFNAEVQSGETFDELLGKFRKDDSTKASWHAAVFSDGLVQDNRWRQMYPASYARRLRDESLRLVLFCVHSGEAPACFSIPGEADTQDPKPNGFLIEVVPGWSRDKQREALITGFGQALRRLPNPPKCLLDEADLALVEQVRGLDAERSFEGGKRILSSLAVRFFDCDEIEINTLSQGFSGAKVFRIVPKKAGVGNKEYALKLNQWDTGWKITSEVKGQRAATDTLGVSGFTLHIPNLKAPRVSADPLDLELQNAACFGNWLALCYDFLGGERFGKFIDLETALTTDPVDLADRVRGTYLAGPPIDQVRVNILQIVLNWLGLNWYMSMIKDRVTRNECPIWSTADAPARDYGALPPYALAGKNKQSILSFIDGPDAILGERLCGDTWQLDRRVIWQLVGKTDLKTSFTRLDRPLPVILSPSHGDMNANNVLLWLNQPNYPFLIDFPFFQTQGHALQDLARLEVAVKFALMDRQRVDSPPGPQAYDYTHTQLKLWMEFDIHTLAAPIPDLKNSWSSVEHTVNLDLSLKLLREIRIKAVDVQRQPAGLTTVPEFFDEYLPALLYYTLLTIGYANLPVFKRLLAVHSCGRMLEKLR
ncbi:MAG: hypothetical protein HY043_11620 [Verrucomicrobia bacterium]|nr:hypothetical protein [Verrucomicrobiota bacterium]